VLGGGARGTWEGTLGGGCRICRVCLVDRGAGFVPAPAGGWCLAARVSAGASPGAREGDMLGRGRRPRVAVTLVGGIGWARGASVDELGGWGDGW